VRKRKCSLLKILILAILIKEGETHGYSLYKEMLHYTSMRWKPSIGTIYRTLNDMAKEGLISKHTEGRKHIYTVTKEGIEYFIKNSKTPLIRMSGTLTTILEAYLKILSINPQALTKELKERLRDLETVLYKYNLR